MKTSHLIRSMHPLFLFCAPCMVITLTALSTITAGASTPSPAPEWFQQTVQNAWLQNYDPTLVSKRVYSEFTYQNLDGGSSIYEIDPSFRGVIPLMENFALGYQIEQPYKWMDTGSDNVSGFADFECRLGVIGRIFDTLRCAGALNFKFDTASDPALGSHAFQLRPIAAFRWDATSHLNLGMNAEYSFTPQDEGDYDSSSLELKFPIAVKISDQWSTSATYKPRWNFLSDDSSQLLELNLGYVWGSHQQFSASAGVEVPLDDQNLQFKSIFSLAWYF